MRERWWIAVIEPQSSSARRARQTRPTVALPKGLVDAGEHPEQTAVREVREETGIAAEQVAKLKDIRYVYLRTWGDRQRVFKVVSFYLLRYTGGKIGEISADMRKEVRGAEWIPLEEAAERLSYSGEREVVQLAADYVAAHGQELGGAPAPHPTEE
jgi:8-oxo-dGTP pyrophosphatase MutT (NUDIX family)